MPHTGTSVHRKALSNTCPSCSRGRGRGRRCMHASVLLFYSAFEQFSLPTDGWESRAEWLGREWSRWIEAGKSFSISSTGWKSALFARLQVNLARDSTLLSVLPRRVQSEGGTLCMHHTQTSSNIYGSYLQFQFISLLPGSKIKSPSSSAVHFSFCGIQLLISLQITHVMHM